MTYVITQSCCNDASCVQACPVGCIHPTPSEPGYLTTEMLYIDPGACIDCAACVDACPVNAVYAEDELPVDLRAYAAINAEYYQSHAVDHRPVPIPDLRSLPESEEPLRVAIVGAGPSGFYAAAELLDHGAGRVKVSMFERLPVPFGLVRHGVAPDHQHTKEVSQLFRRVAAHRDFATFYNVEIGTHVTHGELSDHHHAVVYTNGAAHSRRLGIPGEDLPGSSSATDFVAWYNGHPDYADTAFDLSGHRAVIVGNGNVALDVARILLMDRETLARTDIADHALRSLEMSNIREVVLLGRRDHAHAAFTTPELLGLAALEDIDIVLDDHDLQGASQATDSTVRAKAQALTDVVLAQAGRSRSSGKRIVLRFLASPVAIVGTERVESVTVARNRMIADDHGSMIAEQTAEVGTIETGLVLRSIGYRGRAVADLPFDDRSGTLPNEEGRVIDPTTGTRLKGTYAAGWIKRGPSGVIGTNRADALDTVDALLDDYRRGLLVAPATTDSDLADLIRARRPQNVDRLQWQRIDDHETSAGHAQNRPRVKLTDTHDMLLAARNQTGDGQDGQL
ncbi:FAD-dependent oxidoreductase [Gordonia sp. KTR9]|uniref:FAD-dependent oxidoreductase n=1 Tax=Gordonia sp. KTR9 TaxID=337191 RepID=UPI00027DE127|nr:FAD-dependent oxidoreductase [Gordonia sp. KTR9]AFR51261.1 NADPH-dependent glutamate synthase beta chain-related oxidoreductase [Gordonia sp. KTR9]